MKKFVLLLILLPPCLPASAQTLAPFAVNSSGGEGNAGGSWLAWSVGETSITTLGSGPGQLSQGILQPDANGIFPVKLIYFNGKPGEGRNTLFWATSEETENSHFEIQKSPDGIHFFPMGRIPGSGSTYVRKTYDATDTSPFPNTYYRLKQVDYDGTFSFSSVIYIQQTDAAGFTLYPNPADDVLHLSVGTNFGPLQITVYDEAGRHLLRQTAHQADGPVLKLSGLRPGNYIIQVSGPSAVPIWTARFVKR
ncbi:hypothetical protein GCM10010967_14070 [Dyadobacter beijingensis]|uniref:Secretion system C-terminal sorting domain-containing protein n=1 Tax=Dyadobacter beijingensis TaxID=365489 RepID=A0ABQ2HL39_9BACT|nr:T9SS type A sorting domain-containing protein [Dyadobacter beijingensis]GGM83492.1 hypothetical protein GCM10010967_14070 [Dyadobacter beijingensis]